VKSWLILMSLKVYIAADCVWSGLRVSNEMVSLSVCVCV